MQKWKRFLSLLLATVMCVGLLPGEAHAGTYEKLSYSIADGEVTITDCSTDATEVVIPDEIEGYPVTSIGARAFKECSALTSVTIPNSVTSIGDRAFMDCSSLTSITIPDGVTSIAYSAFADCSSLTSITIPDGVTSIGDYAFSGCSTLQRVTIPAGVADIGIGVFSATTSLKRIVVAVGNTKYSSDASGVLYKKNTLLSAPGGLNGTYRILNGVTSIEGSAFDGCSSLTSITIPDSVTSIGDRAFAHCSSLASITIPDGVTSIAYCAFADCSSLTSITIPDGVTSIACCAFLNCSSLTSITIPDGVESIQADAFWRCDALEFIYFKGNAPTFSGGCFGGVTATAYYPEDDVTWTEDVRQDYGDNITWVAYDPAHTHDWADATCTTPKTCKTCGATEGEALGHDFGDNEEYCIRGCGAQNPDYKPETPVDPEPVKPVKPAKPTPAPVGPTPVTPAEPELPDEPVLPENPFADVHENDFFYDAVIWAVNNGITSGSGANTFAPDRACTRAEMVTFLWRAAGKPEPVSGNNPFTDVAEADYFYKAVLWAVENGITKGTSESTFSPNDTCTRGQAVTFLYRYAGAPEITVGNPFADVQENNYYYHAVIWAVAEEITKGTGENTFSPDNFCTRSQIVTFLYRYSTK